MLCLSYVLTKFKGVCDVFVVVVFFLTLIIVRGYRVPVEAVACLPPCVSSALARQLRVQRMVHVLRVVDVVLNPVRIHLDGSRDFVHETITRCVEMNSLKLMVPV